MQFWPRDARVIATDTVVRCLSVRLSVTFETVRDTDSDSGILIGTYTFPTQM